MLEQNIHDLAFLRRNQNANIELVALQKKWIGLRPKALHNMAINILEQKI